MERGSPALEVLRRGIEENELAGPFIVVDHVQLSTCLLHFGQGIKFRQRGLQTLRNLSPFDLTAQVDFCLKTGAKTFN